MLAKANLRSIDKNRRLKLSAPFFMPSFALRQNIVYCMHFLTGVAKVRAFINPRLLIKSAVDE
ncbi:hypothetical protein [Treponema socranskii]|uniref:hypothetical protein n=1 Tax=Treponema socranskii TaxID=53419 RepID=UPI0028720073|nr:hypothetical protein [Treponema socranskii]MDR9859492.1 hypothetical protein [Treponema socranskii]